MSGKDFFSDLKRAARTERRTLVCARHGEYKADCVVLAGGGVVSPGCPECARLAAEDERSEMRRRREAAWRSQNVEREFFGKTFGDFVPRTPSQRDALDAVRRLVGRRSGKVVLLGPNGVGKTMLASIAAMELGGRIHSMYEISAMIRQSYTARAARSELEIVGELASVPFLAIDELGRTKGGDAEQNWLSYILDKRHARGLPFMLTGNAHFKRFCKQGGCPMCFENFVGNDVLSRLHQDSEVVAIEAPDERVARR